MNMIQSVVSNGIIEIKAPAEIHDGEIVSVLVVGHAIAEDPMTDQEITQALKAIDEFNDTFPVQEDGEDLSEAARVAGKLEKSEFMDNANKLKRMFD